MDDWISKAEYLKYEKGLSWRNVAIELADDIAEPDLHTRMERIRRRLRNSDNYRPEGTEQKPLRNYEPETFRKRWRGNRTIRFGLLSDTHFASKYVQITHLHTFYDLLHDEGITDVYHAGDIDDGEQMRVGHQYECYVQGADDHTEEIIQNYPTRDGMTTYFITGNHDSSLIKRAGYNIGRMIALRRPDMKYLGQDCAIVELTPNCNLELFHPWDGSSYALSYKPQKIIDAMSGGEKPSILAIGHYHKAEYLFYRNVHCLQTGTFEAQTPFMRGKSLAAHVGGWIIELEVDKSGEITRFKPEFIPFYKAINEDYKGWRQ